MTEEIIKEEFDKAFKKNFPEAVIIDGVDVAGCEYYTQDYQRANNLEGRYEHCKDVCELNGDNYFYCKIITTNVKQ